MACNTGVSLSPIIDGTSLSFRTAGLHNGLALMEDLQTRSYWDHTNGECIHGSMRGTLLERSVPLRYFPAETTLRRYPQARVALSRPGFRQRALHRVFLRRMLKDEGHLPFMFHSTLAKDDERRPRMELGLGVWWPGTSRFYPMELLRKQGGAVFDTVGERRVLVFIDPESQAPVAGHCDAKECRWDGNDLVLDTQDVIRDLTRVEPNGTTHPFEHIPQMFTRWYGFSATFPGCEVYEP